MKHSDEWREAPASAVVPVFAVELNVDVKYPNEAEEKLWFGEWRGGACLSCGAGGAWQTERRREVPERGRWGRSTRSGAVIGRLPLSWRRC